MICVKFPIKLSQNHINECPKTCLPYNSNFNCLNYLLCSSIFLSSQSRFSHGKSRSAKKNGRNRSLGINTHISFSKTYDLSLTPFIFNPFFLIYPTFHKNILYQINKFFMSFKSG